MSQSKPVVAPNDHNRKRLGKIIFSVFSLCIVAVSIAFFILSIFRPYTGLTLSKTNSGWEITYVDPNSLAAEVNLKVGDRPVEINGQPSQLFLKNYEKAGIVFGYLVKEITVIDNNGQVKSLDTGNTRLLWKSRINPMIWLILSLTFWFAGFYVYFRKPGNLTSMLLCLCGLVLGLALSGNIAASRSVPGGSLAALIFPTIGPWMLLHFFIVLPEERAWIKRKPALYLIYLPAAILLILLPVIGFSNGQPVAWFRMVRFFGIVIGFLAIVGVAIYNYVGTSSVRTRQQMKIILFSCLLSLVPMLALSYLPMLIWGQAILDSTYAFLFLAFIPIGMGYAVITQRLLDIEFIIRRSLIYGFITIAMAAILSLAIIPFVTLQESVSTPFQILFALVLGGIAAILFGPVKQGFEVLVDKIFYKDRYDYRQIIHNFSISLNNLKEFPDITRLIVGTAVNTLNLSGGCLFLKEYSNFYEVYTAQGNFTAPEKQQKLTQILLTRDSRFEYPNPASSLDTELAFLIPLVAGDKEMGILCLSSKTTRQAFSSDDIYLIQGLISVAAVSLRNALLLREVSIRDTFISIASHELRSPLTSIIGYAELLLRRQPPETTRQQWLTHIVDNGKRITSMADDLLNVTRIQTGKVSMKLEHVDLPEILNERLDMVKETSQKHEFFLKLDAGLPKALVDPDKFGQVVQNLLSNAVKYSPNGGLVVLSANRDATRNKVVVSVSDRGIGISPEDQEFLFITFHRIQRPETRGIRGSGLGLYIVKEWIEAMGGSVWLESELNKGSTFFVSVPASNSSNLN